MAVVLQEKNNNYIEYTSKGDRYENHLNMIRPCSRNLINEHKPIVELNNDNNNNNNNNNANRGEGKIQLRMQNSCISTKSFGETRTIHSKSEQVEVFIGSDTEHVIDKFFTTLTIFFTVVFFGPT